MALEDTEVHAAQSRHPLDVVVPGGRDAAADYAGCVPPPGAAGHPPVNFHAMAAATGGAFHADPAAITNDGRAVLLLLAGDAGRAVEAAAFLKRAGHPVLAAWKECGRHQLERSFQRPGHGRNIDRIRGIVDGFLSPSPASAEFLAVRLPDAEVFELPTPCPVDLAEWAKLADAPAGRSGIFLGTGEWRVPSRRHADAVRIAVRLAGENPGVRITAVNREGLAGLWHTLRACGLHSPVRLVRPMTYIDYLRCIAGHRIVLQRDESGVPGQVAGDAALAGVPCMGGNGGIDRLVFPHLPGSQSGDDEVARCAGRLLSDDGEWSAAAAAARSNALAEVSFTAFRKLWETVRSRIGRAPGGCPGL